MTQSQSMRWLQIACLITIITGLVCAMGSHPATDVVWRTLFDLLKWPLDGDPATFNADTRAVNAVLGGTMVGWGVLMYLIATPQQFAAIPAPDNCQPAVPSAGTCRCKDVATAAASARSSDSR